MSNTISIRELKTLIEKTIKKNEAVGGKLRKYSPILSHGQQQILRAAENIEKATELLRQADYVLDTPKVLLSDQDIDRIAKKAAMLMPDDPKSHYHCAEAFAIAVGDHFFGKIHNRTRRMTTGFSGGVGGTHEEMCGALFGGVLIIGAIFGRAWAFESDQICYQKSVRYREAFIKEFGGSSCQSIKDTGYGSQGIYPCSVFVEKAAKLFLRVLIEDL